MKKIALVFIFGTFLLLGSCGPFIMAIQRGTASNSVHTQAISLEQSTKTDLIVVDTTHSVKLSLKLDITSDTITEIYQNGEDRYKGQFAFPLEYAIYDEQGEVIEKQKHIVDWNSGSRSYSHNYTNREHADLSIETEIKELKISPPGKIYIELTVFKDSKYRAQAKNIELYVYDNVQDFGVYIFYGVMMILGGIIVLIIGVVLAIIRASKNKPVASVHNVQTEKIITEKINAAETPQTHTTINTGINERSISMWMHLSQLGNYFFPLLGYIAPFIIWMSNKDKSPYINEQGKDVINFRISMFIYYFISFVLMFVVIGFLIILLLLIFELVVVIIGASRANEGIRYQYPLAIPFIK